VGDRLLHASIGGLKEEPRPAASQPLTPPLIRDPGSGSGTARRLALVANTAVLCCRRFASAVDFSAAGDEFSTWAESLCL
jgi:hypothetical protein